MVHRHLNKELRERIANLNKQIRYSLNLLADETCSLIHELEPRFYPAEELSKIEEDLKACCEYAKQLPKLANASHRIDA